MKIISPGDYLIVLNNNQQLNCKILGEFYDETGYCAYLFITKEGELFTENRLGHIPEAIYDQRNIVTIEKKNIKNVFSIYVVNSKYYDEKYVKYKVGRKNMYRISYQYKKDSNIKTDITDSMFPFCTYSELLMNEGHDWTQITKMLVSNELNNRYDYFTFTNCVSDRIQHEISLYKNDNRRSSISFTMISILPELVIELFKDICRNPLCDIERCNVISRFNNEYGLLRVTNEEHKQSFITIVVNDVDRLKPIFGDDFHMYPCNHPYEGGVDIRNMMYRIPKFESNIKLRYDIASKSLKISFLVSTEMVTAVHPKENPLSLHKKWLETQIVDREFFDQTIQRTVKIVDINIETNKNLRRINKDELVIYGYVVDAKFLKLELQTIEKLKYKDNYKKSICYKYKEEQFDIANEQIKFYDKKQKRVLEQAELSKQFLTKHAYHEDMDDDDDDGSDEELCLQNLHQNKKLRNNIPSPDVFIKINRFVNKFEESDQENELNNIDKNGFNVILQIKGVLNTSRSLSEEDILSRIVVAFDFINIKNLSQILAKLGLKDIDTCNKNLVSTYAKNLYDHIVSSV